MGNLQCREKHVTNIDCIYAAKVKCKSMIRQLGCIEREHISFKTSDHWKTGQPYKNQSKEDVTMFVVANQAGLDKFLHMQQLRQQIARASLKHDKKRIILNDIAQIETSNTDIDSELRRGLYEPKTFDQATSIRSPMGPRLCPQHR